MLAKPIPLLFAIIVICTTGCLDLQTAKIPDSIEAWHEQTQNNLSVKFPVKPRKETKVANAPPLGKLNCEMFICELSRRKVLMITQTTYPIPPSQYDVRAGIKGAVDAIVKEAKATIVSNEKTNHNGIAGTELLLNIPSQNALTKSRIFIDGNGPTYYQVQALGNEAFLNSEVVNQFFESMRIEPIDSTGGQAKRFTKKPQTRNAPEFEE